MSIFLYNLLCSLQGLYDYFGRVTVLGPMIIIIYFLIGTIVLEDVILTGNTLLAFYQKSPWVASNLQLSIFGTILLARVSLF